MQEHEDQARELGATVILLEQNKHELRDKQSELRNWTRRKRHEFFIQSIRRERQLILSNGLRLQSERIRLEIELERARDNVNRLVNRGKITRLADPYSNLEGATTKRH